MMNVQGFIKHKDYWELSLTDFSAHLSGSEWVTQLIFEKDKEVITLDIEVSFTFRAKDGSSKDLSPGGTQFHPLASACDAGPRSLRAYQNGNLSLVFNNDAAVNVNSSSQFEAWNVTGNAGLKIVSTTNGGLGVWQ